MLDRVGGDDGTNNGGISGGDGSELTIEDDESMGAFITGRTISHGVMSLVETKPARLTCAPSTGRDSASASVVRVSSSPSFSHPDRSGVNLPSKFPDRSGISS